MPGHKRQMSDWVGPQGGADAPQSDDEFHDASSEGAVEAERQRLIREGEYFKRVKSVITLILAGLHNKKPSSFTARDRIQQYQAAADERRALLGDDEHAIAIQLAIRILEDAIVLEQKFSAFAVAVDAGSFRSALANELIASIRSFNEVEILRSIRNLEGTLNHDGRYYEEAFPNEVEPAKQFAQAARQLVGAPLVVEASMGRRQSFVDALEGAPTAVDGNHPDLVDDPKANNGLEKALRSPTSWGDTVSRWRSDRPYILGVLFLSAIAALISIPLAPAMPAVLAGALHHVVLWKALTAISVFFYLPGFALLLDTVRNHRPSELFWDKVYYGAKVVLSALMMVPALVFMMPGAMIAIAVKLGVFGMPATGSLGALYLHGIVLGGAIFAGFVAAAQVVGSSLVLLANYGERQGRFPRAMRWLRGVGEAIIVLSPSLLAFGVATMFRTAGQVILQGAHQAWQLSAAEVAQWHAEVHSLLNQAVVPLWEMAGAFVSGVVAWGFYQAKDEPIAGKAVEGADVLKASNRAPKDLYRSVVTDDYGYGDGHDHDCDRLLDNDGEPVGFENA